MCAIAGILFKHNNRTFKLTTGEALTLILDSTVHRGMDSCGWALYKDPIKDTIRMRFFIPTDETAASEIKRIEETLSAQQVTILRTRRLGCTLGVHAGFSGDLLALTHAIEKDLKPLSMGTRLDIVKDVGMPYDVAPIYNIGAFNGSHGIAHNRLATESGVRPETAHPFWACGFSDIATVHNGQLTNYWIMRRRLERKGMVFQTENDTELVAVYLAYQMSCNMSLEDSLKASLDDLDGTFSYMVATKDSIGYAKDKLAAKPMVKYENDEMIVIASEEVGINRLFLENPGNHRTGPVDMRPMVSCFIKRFHGK